MELLDLDSIKISEGALNSVSKEICEEYKIFPYKVMGKELFLATVKELSENEIKYLSFIIRKNINLKVCKENQISTYINKYYEESYRKALVSGFSSATTENIPLDYGEARGPIVDLVNSIIRDGVLKGASDIHIEPLEENTRIRYRIDGSLVASATKIPQNMYNNIGTRIKVMARMDIANKYEPQDGEIDIKLHEESYDFRVSSLPTIHGEKFVLRILKRHNRLLELNNLGFKEKDYKVLEDILKFKQGLIIITGPTGSGKTSTLYAMVRKLNEECRNIITVEKPVECDIDGINQVSIGAKGNLEYGEVLKAALRQDPDIIMVGEIIDRDTAEIAVRASLTGHLVLTTLHTNDASSTINRLMDMGIRRELINNSLLMVIAQRLTRVICNYCKTSKEISKCEESILNINESSLMVFHGEGCHRCNNTGYKGRAIAYEIMIVGNRVKEAMKSEDNRLIREAAMENGMIVMEDYFKELVLNGITTVEEFHSNLHIYNVERGLGVDYGI